MANTVVINVGKKKIVTTDAVKFATLTAGRSKKESVNKILSKSSLYSRYVASSTNPDIPTTAIALYKKGAVTKEASGKISLGCLFATFCVNRNVFDAILVINVNKDFAATVAVVNGIPNAESCGKPDHIRAIADDYFASAYTAGCVVYGDADLFIGGNVLKCTPEMMLAEIQEGKKPKEVAALLKTLHISHFGVHPIVFVIAGLLVVAGIAFNMHLESEKKKVLQASRDKIAASEKNKNNAFFVFEEAQTAALAKEFKGCSTTELETMMSQAFNFDITTNGWNLVSLQLFCEETGDKAGQRWYIAEYKPDETIFPRGTNQMLIDGLKGIKPTFSRDLKSAIIKVELPPRKEDEPGLKSEDLLNENTFLLKYGTILQQSPVLLGIQATISGLTPIASTAVPEGYEGDAYFNGQFTAKGTLKNLSAFLSAMDKVMRVSSVKLSGIKNGEIPTFDLQGTYYAQTKAVVPAESGETPPAP